MGNVLSPSDFYHTGVVVPDVERAARALTELAGYTWTSRITMEVPIWMEGVEKPLTFSLVYSIEAPHIELVQQIPGTPWMPAGTTATHHLGYFCDDLVATGAKLAENGLRCESHAVIDSGMALFAYYVDSDGLRVELVDRAVFPDWPGFLRGKAAYGDVADSLSPG